MAGNPLIQQGTLNRLIASVVWAEFPELNVTAPFLGKEGITLSLEGNATTFIDSMTGAVTSPEPYQVLNLGVHLLKSQNLAALYKAQMELSTLLGDGDIFPDTTTLPFYAITNSAIESVERLSFNGTDAGWMVNIKGYYIINNALWP